MRSTLFTLLLLAVSGIASAQYTLSGDVKDTLNHAPCPQASVVVFNKKDSAIVAHTRTSADGSFSIAVPDSSTYLVRVSYMGFADFLDDIAVQGKITVIGSIPMVSKEHVLKEFVVTQQIAAIKIKGDTTEYMADSFVTRQNATVEDLLKKLPGIQVDKNGKITAQGSEVKKILVDGEEFFSDDPKVVTKGLQANAVDKVQVFDKKSDQAEFTGIDDGDKTKTINLELKEDKKKGYFGKIDAGGGTGGYYQSQSMINAFKGKRQVSAFGIMSNTDKAGLGWSDMDKFSGGNSYIYSDDGDMMFTAASGEQDFAGWNGKYEGEGLPKTWTGGLHFADKWNKDKFHFSGNYRYARQNVEISGTSTTQYVLPDDKGFVQLAEKNQFSSNDRSGFDGMFECKLDTLTSLKISFDGSDKTTHTSSLYNTGSANADGTFRNLNLRNITSISDARYINSSILFRKKFLKVGRSISIDIRENYKESNSEGYLRSDTRSEDTASPYPYVQLTNQKKENKANTFLFSSKVIYTEPLSKVTFLEFTYLLTTNHSVAKNYSFDSTGYNEYDSINQTYTSNYVFRIINNRAGINFRYADKKITIAVGSDISNANYQQDDYFRTNSLNRDYWNVFPAASFTYKFKKQTSLNFSYRGNTRQPTIDQVQTLQQNADPLNITIGNPKLKQEFTNRFYLRYNDYKVLTSQYSYVSLSYRSVADAISSNFTATAQGNKTQYINVNGNYSADLYASRGAKLRKPEVYIGGHFTSGISHTLNFINDTANISNNNSYGFGPNFDYEKEDVFEVSGRSDITFNENSSSISKFSGNYWILTSELSASVQLTKKIEIGSSVDYTARQRTEVFNQNNNVVRWNAYFAHKFLKNNQLTVQAAVYDLLNQNLGYERESQNGIITESRYNTIRRYGMLNVIWNFTRSPGNAAKPDDNDD